MFLRACIVLLFVFTQSVPFFPVTQAIEIPTVVINELMWMGSSASSADEWIELRNTSDQQIDISGWKMTKKSGEDNALMLTIPENQFIAPRAYYLIANYADDATNSHLAIAPDLVETDVALVNSALQIGLYTSQDELIDSADDGVGKPLAGEYTSGEIWKSMERVREPSDGTRPEDWKTSSAQVNFDAASPEYGTPGAENSNTAPAANAGEDFSIQVGETATFDASLSEDADHDTLSYSWDFDDGGVASGITPTHVYQHEGEYHVVLIVSDGMLTSSDEVLVSVSLESVLPTPETQEDNPGEEESSDPEYMRGNVLLNEVFPNPSGRDQEAEFIELYNADDKAVSLSGWKVTNDKSSYHFDDQVIAPGAFLSISYSTSKVLLRNSGGVVRLVNPFNEIVSGLEYGVAEEAMSFARVNDTTHWEWTSLPTPGSENEIEQDISSSNTEVEGDSNAIILEKTNETNTSLPKNIKVAEIAGLDPKTLVQVEGVVTAAPGMFSVSSFWLQDESGAAEVSSTNKLFPELELGNLVRVIGTVSSAGEGLRINQRKDEIEVIGVSVVAPEELQSDDLNEALIGHLVSVQGQITKSAKTKLTLRDEQGELAVVAKKGTELDLSSFSVDEPVQILGILGWTSAGPQIWPRTIEDIQIAGEVLGEATSLEAQTPLTDSTAIVNDDRKVFPTWLVMVIIGVMLSLGAWWYWKHRVDTTSHV